MTKERIPAENPTTAIFDLAEHMSNNYYKIVYLKYYAYIFIGITLFLLLILSITFLTQGNIGFAIIIFAIIISGLMLLRLIIFTKNFLDDFNTNFRAIKLVRDIDPLPKIPAGKTAVDRFEAYLKNQDPTVSQEIKLGVEIKRNYSFGKTKWDLALLRQPRSFGPMGHLTLMCYEKSKLKLKQIIKLEKNLEASVSEPMLPARVVVLNKAPDNYNGISDDLYSYLTEKAHYILKNGKKHSVKLQVFVEHNGRYEIIPLLP